ncbi:hypothetical protein J31TS4_19460 [Paenibacillus sp. J31TS4]|uniref:hypothetical protein n=1 Tax=Paenibacillus sp. J31TS4 TaxID=2807195 RepID=UPI001B14B39C|nr:hypothetical protein [Paenibacillus sp. J31TS4]GIP38666.1 hypothetical protein J31TS4_19460 [Paenibacillus sp. J31TS4]
MHDGNVYVIKDGRVEIAKNGRQPKDAMLFGSSRKTPAQALREQAERIRQSCSFVQSRLVLATKRD